MTPTLARIAADPERIKQPEHQRSIVASPQVSLSSRPVEFDDVSINCTRQHKFHSFRTS